MRTWRRLARPVGVPRTPEPAVVGTLRDSGAEAAFRTEGFAVVDLLDRGQTAALRSLCDSRHPTPGTGWESDFYSPDPGTKRAVNEGIRDILASPIGSAFVDHVSVLHNFILNWPGPDGGLPLHQHSTVVHESSRRAAVVWCAVTEATEWNGTLHVVPGSHRIQVGPHPERTPSWHEPHGGQIMRDHLVSVSLDPGQAVVFDNHLLHCTFHNQTDSPRISAGAVVIPACSEFIYCDPVASDRANIHRVDPDFFIQNTAGHLQWAPPEGLDPVAEVPWAPVEVPASTIPDLLPAGTCSHPDDQ